MGSEMCIRDRTIGSAGRFGTNCLKLIGPGVAGFICVCICVIFTKPAAWRVAFVELVLAHVLIGPWFVAAERGYLC